MTLPLDFFVSHFSPEFEKVGDLSAKLWGFLASSKSALFLNRSKTILQPHNYMRLDCFTQLSPTMSCQTRGHKTTCSFTFAPPAKRKRAIHVHSTSNSSHQPTTLDNSRRLAYFRAQETLRSLPLLVDTYGTPLAETFTTAYPPSDTKELAAAAFDMISARFIDDQILLALNSVNTGRDQPYNQLVLVGDGYCTRPFRLNVPAGTIMYLVAPGEVHERAEALLAELPVKARVPRGCLLKRIDCNFVEGNSCSVPLEMAGYRADRVSVWALQVRGRNKRRNTCFIHSNFLHDICLCQYNRYYCRFYILIIFLFSLLLQGIRQLDLNKAAISSIFADISNLAALESLLFGELSATTPAGVENLLASFGLLGTQFDVKSVAQHIESTDKSPSWWNKAICAGLSRENSENLEGPLLFRAQQRRLSLREIELYESHVSAAEEVDEDFFGNFS
jgi:hypothetical protein